MLRTAVRASGIGLAVCGLAVALAPAAGASPIKPPPAPPVRPVTQTLSGSTTFGVDSPCNGTAVDTSGKATVATITTGQNTVVTFDDIQSGDGYSLIILGAGDFNSLSASYSVKATAIWLDLKNLKDSFHGTLTSTIPVTSANAPDGLSSSVDSTTCGL
jgi:hypothetical protein